MFRSAHQHPTVGARLELVPANRRPPARPGSRTPRSQPSQAVLEALRPILPDVMSPVVEPVVERLDRQGELLLDLKAALDVQFQRIDAIQAQLDTLIAQWKRERRR